MRNNITGNVFLGIDVHKRTYSVTAVSENIIVKHSTMPADPQILLAYIKKFFATANVYSAYEAGFSGLSLHRFLLDNGIDNIVIHAASIEIESRNKVKNDKRDSQKIAFQLSYGRLKCINIPSPQRESWRAISRLRAQYVQEKARFSCKIKALLFYFGMLSHNHKGKTSRKWLKSLLTLVNVNEDVFFSLKMLIESWEYLHAKIKLIDKRLKEQAVKDSRVGSIYLRFPGIGFTTSRVLANELDDLSQFHSERRLYSFTGLTPCEHSSGDSKHIGRISRQGNPIIRGILTEAAWKAIKKDPKLEEVFDRLVQNTGSRKKAILGIARRMIGHIKAEFKNEKNREMKLCVD